MGADKAKRRLRVVPKDAEPVSTEDQPLPEGSQDGTQEDESAGPIPQGGPASRHACTREPYNLLELADQGGVVMGNDRGTRRTRRTRCHRGTY